MIKRYVHLYRNFMLNETRFLSGFYKDTIRYLYELHGSVNYNWIYA